MKVISKFKGETINHKSYAAFYRWAIGEGFWAIKGGVKHFGANTSSLLFKQNDGSELRVERIRK